MHQLLIMFVIVAYRYVVYAVLVWAYVSLESCRMRHEGTIITLCQCDTTITAEWLIRCEIVALAFMREWVISLNQGSWRQHDIRTGTSAASERNFLQS